MSGGHSRHATFPPWALNQLQQNFEGKHNNNQEPNLTSNHTNKIVTATSTTTGTIL